MKNGRLSRLLSVISVVLLDFILSFSSYAQQAAKPQASKPVTPAKTEAEGPDKVVLKVGNAQCTEADLDFLISNLGAQAQKAVAQQGRRPLGEEYALMLVLSQQALKDHLDDTPRFRRQMALQHAQALFQAELAKLAEQVQVTPEEVSQYYTTHASDYDQAKVREFVVRKKSDSIKAGTPGLSAQEAAERAESIRKALVAGTELKKIIDQFGGASDVLIDVEPRTIRRGQLLPALDKAAFEMKEGEISAPLDNSQAIAFLQIIGHDRRTLKDVTPEIENTLHQKGLEAAVADLKGKINIWMDEEYFKAPTAPPAAQSSQPKP